MPVELLDVAGRRVGPGEPCFVIAEAGVNHNGDIDLAKRLIEVAVQAGADAVKFQTFQASRLATAHAPKALYQQRNDSNGQSQLQMLRRLELTEDDHRALVAYSRRRGIIFLSSPFDEESADLLDRLGVPVFKVPSGEITNLSLVEHVARKGKPMFVSTGMSTLGEVESAVETIERAGNRSYVLLHCVSNYPADPADVHLRTLETLSQAFGVPVGYSDHTLGTSVALAAVARGACVVEKHFTLDRGLPGPDHQASAEPAELAALVRGIRTVEQALGDGRKRPSPAEANTAAVARKSLVAARDIAAGVVLTEDLIAVRRPGTGLPPTMRSQLLNRTLRQNVAAGTVFRLEMLA